MKRFREWWGRNKGSIAWLALVVLAAVGFFRIQTVADDSNHALCALRSDLERRVQSTEEFIQHPKDFPQFNDPKTIALIKAQVTNQKATIAALGSLSCD